MHLCLPVGKRHGMMSALTLRNYVIAQVADLLPRLTPVSEKTSWKRGVFWKLALRTSNVGGKTKLLPSCLITTRKACAGTKMLFGHYFY